MIAGYILGSVAVLAIIAAMIVHLWPSMEPYHPPRLVMRMLTPDEPTVELPLSRLRDTGGYLGGVHVDCLRARAAGEEICDDCVPVIRVGAA